MNIQKEKVTPQTRKDTRMKKATMNAIVNYINDNSVTELFEIRDELVAELNKGAEKAQANRDMYAEAHDIVMDALSDTPVTIAELYAEVEDRLPEGMTKGKVQYAVTRLWTDEITKVEGKVNGYTRKA